MKELTQAIVFTVPASMHPQAVELEAVMNRFFEKEIIFQQGKGDRSL
ncbi:MAG: hypothetical protein KAG92_03835 [Deltaproteobacteria bacterium]|nr:hypothetical protein [Deltaproteobacteria bacterium]